MVGQADHALDLVAVIGDPVSIAGRDVDVPVEVQDPGMFQFFPELPVFFRNRVSISKVAEHQEFVTPVPVAVANAVDLEQGLADLLQDLVAVAVAKVVIELLKVVHVQHHGQDWLAGIGDVHLVLVMSIKKPIKPTIGPGHRREL